jgi:two-component system, OmpR family, response regulator RegX3
VLDDEPDRVFTRHQIMEHLWQTPYVGDTRACDAHISNLRRKIERDPAHPERILTVRETGYKLVAV